MRSIREPETRRLRGVPGHRERTPDLLSLYSDARVAERLWPGSQGGPRTRAQVERILLDDEFRWHEDGFGPWLFYRQLPTQPLRKRGQSPFSQLAGRAGVRRFGDEVELLYAVRPELWRQGYATEMASAVLDLAFGPLALDTVIALVLPCNAGSRAVLDRLGFTPEDEVMHAGLPHLRLRATSAGRP